MERKEVEIEQTSIEIIDGDRGKNYPKNNELTSSGYCLFLSAANVTKSGLQFINNSFITKEKDALLRKGKLFFNDVVLTTRGTVGNVGLYSDDVPYKNMRINSGMVIIRPGKDFDTMFLYQYLRSCYFKAQITQYQSGSAQPQLPISTLQKMKVVKPNIAAQRRIASILSSLDRKIELNNKINADLEEMAQAIFKNWFVDFEPFKDGKFVDSELGMIPEGWEVGTLEDLITIKYGKDHKKLEDGTFPVYGSGGLMRFVNSWLYDGESVLIPRKGTLDNIMYVCEKFWTVDTMFFSAPKMDYVMKYVYNYIKRFDFSKMNEGTSVPSNTAARLNKMQILIPTHEVLEMYDETLCPIYNKRKMNDKESRTLSTLRDTLLPRLMSGELEIPE